MNLKLYAIGAAAIGLALGGYRVGVGLTEAKYLKAAEARQSTVERQRYKRAQRVTVVVSSPVREKAIHEVTTKEVFRDAHCDVGPDGVRVANEALTGRNRSPGNRELPANNGAQ